MIEQARHSLLPMGITSENVASRYGITRQEQDQAAVGLVFLIESLLVFLSIAVTIYFSL